MKTRTWLIVVTIAAVLAGLGQRGLADAKPNPYQPIIDRNAFGLKPPPPPPDPAAAIPTPPPPSNVKLTGITSMFGPGSKRAMLEIVETGPGKLPKKPTLKEGEREGSVEVVSIDVEKGLVKILNNGIEATIGFTNEVAKAGPIPTAPYPGTPAIPTFPPPTTSMTPGNVAVPVPGAITSSGRTGVAMSSGPTTSPAMNVLGALGSPASLSGGQPSGGYSGVNVSAGTTLSSSKADYINVPTRNLRVPTTTATSTDGSTPARPQYTREQIELLIEAQRMRQPGLPYPPTSINPRPGPIVPQSEQPAQ